MNRCQLCPNNSTCVAPDGPPSEIEFIGEAPGWEENRHGRPFIGKTGREVNEHYLPLVPLKRELVRFDNAISCMPDRPKGKLDWHKEADRSLLQSCAANHLYGRWAVTRTSLGLPKLIVPMGNFACKAVDPDIDLDTQHGMPVKTRLGIIAFPMWHPAGGIHEPKKMLQIRTDWVRLGRYIKGKLKLPIDQHPDVDYSEVTNAKEIREIDPTLSMACDTETSRKYGPYCLTYSQYPGTGRLIRATRPDLLVALQEKLDEWEGTILFHNWLYDWLVTENMGLNFPHKLVRDTMVTCFHLGNVPQGLKALAYRYLGMAMQSFEDLVRPYSTQMVLNYFEMAQMSEWPKPPEQLVVDDKTGKWKVYKPQSMSTKLKRFFTDYSKNPEKDVFKMFEENWVEWQELIEQQVGPYPGMDIAHAPEEEVLHYACRDADATIRLWPILQKMKENAKLGKLQEHWEM
jgi:DNA polymerase